jgi:hypothetical protein
MTLARNELPPLRQPFKFRAVRAELTKKLLQDRALYQRILSPTAQ